MPAWIEHTLQDLRYALRGLRRNPGFTLTAVLAAAVSDSIPPFGAGAYVAARWLRAQLFQVAPGDPRPLLIAAALLVLVAPIAAAGPARRAAQVDPMTTLRAE